MAISNITIRHGVLREGYIQDLKDDENIVEFARKPLSMGFEEHFDEIGWWVMWEGTGVHYQSNKPWLESDYVGPFKTKNAAVEASKNPGIFHPDFCASDYDHIT